MAADLIRYDIIVQDAMRGAIRKVLEEVARGGLPGEHHFYITFATRHPGVKLSQRLRAQYENEMTIILQYQFWDLVVTEGGFEVGLSFGGIPERLNIPFRAISMFRDPSVEFALGFNVAGELPEAGPPLLVDAARTKENGGREGKSPDATVPKAKGDVVAPLTRRAPKGDAPAKDAAAAGKAGASRPARAERDKPKAVKSSEPPAAPAPKSGDEAKGAVVSLDAFRKKP